MVAPHMGVSSDNLVLFLKAVVALGLFGALALPLFATATIPTVYTPDNFWTSPHDQPASFSQNADGGFSGVTQTGKRFVQTSVSNQADVRLHRFAIDEAFFYVSDRGVIRASDDIVALSIYLSIESGAV